MICPKCNKPIDVKGIECPFCGIVIAKYKPDEHFKSGMAPSGSEVQKTIPNIPYFKIGVVVIGIILIWVIFKPKYVAELSVISQASGEATNISCAGKEKCVIAYLAPW